MSDGNDTDVVVPRTPSTVLWHEILHARRDREETIRSAFPGSCVAALLVAPLRDLRTEKEWWVWLSVDPAGEFDGTFNLIYEAEGSLSQEILTIGEERSPAQIEALDERRWYDYSLDNESIGDMVLACDEPIDFMLEHGIAPGQPFLMRFHGFWVSGPTYFGEYDDGFDADFVCAIPVTAEAAAAGWEKWLGDFVYAVGGADGSGTYDCKGAHGVETREYIPGINGAGSNTCGVCGVEFREPEQSPAHRHDGDEG